MLEELPCVTFFCRRLVSPVVRPVGSPGIRPKPNMLGLGLSQVTDGTSKINRSVITKSLPACKSRLDTGLKSCLIKGIMKHLYDGNAARASYLPTASN